MASEKSLEAAVLMLEHAAENRHSCPPHILNHLATLYSQQELGCWVQVRLSEVCCLGAPSAGRHEEAGRWTEATQLCLQAHVVKIRKYLVVLSTDWDAADLAMQAQAVKVQTPTLLAQQLVAATATAQACG